MLKIALAALAFVFPVGAALAQEFHVDRNSSNVDVVPMTISSPGTVGAMDSVVRGIATSPDDVDRQQAGHRTASEGAGVVREGMLVSSYGHPAGTVGATPGSTPAR